MWHAEVLEREMSEDTLPKLLRRNYKKYGDHKVAMRQKNFGVWNEYTWKDYYENVKYFALGLISLGLEPGDKVCIIGDNDPQWHWADLATQAVGSTPVGIFTDCVPTEVKYVAENSESKFAVARDQEQVDKFLALRAELPNLKKVIYWDPAGLWGYDDPLLIPFDEILDLGKKRDELYPDTFEQLVEKGGKDDIAFLAYTSGTTGLPKGALVSQYNLVTIGENWHRASNFSDKDQYVAMGPMAWVAEHWFGESIALREGMVVNFPEAPETVQTDLREIAPQLFIAGPRGWEGYASRIQALITDSGILNRMFYKLFLPVGYKTSEQRRRYQLSMFWKALWGLSHLAVFRPLTDKLGLLKLKSPMNAGGLLAVDVFRYLCALGIDMKQGYGLSEGGWLTFHRSEVKFETVGQAMPGVQTRITDEGEIVVKGSVVSDGYWKNAEATKEKFEYGWFHTGDAGYVDEDGHLVIIDRLADLVSLPEGGKFSPGYLESRLRFSPYIDNAMVMGGEDKPYIVALVSVNFDNVSRWAESKRIVYTTLVDLSQKPEIYELIKRDIERLNRSLPAMTRIKKFSNLYKELDADEAELTRTGKLRRGYAATQYGDLLDVMYSAKDEFGIEAEVKYRDGKKGTVKTSMRIVSVD